MISQEMIGSQELTLRLCRQHRDQLRKYVWLSNDYNGHPNVLPFFKQVGLVLSDWLCSVPSCLLPGDEMESFRLCVAHRGELYDYLRQNKTLNILPFFSKKGSMRYSNVTCSISLPSWLSLDEIREHIESNTYLVNAPNGFSKWLLPNQRK